MTTLVILFFIVSDVFNPCYNYFKRQQDIAIPLEDLVKPEDDTLHSAVDTSLPIETYQLFAIIVKSEEERFYACIRTGGEASDK